MVEKFPTWAAEEIANASFEYQDMCKGSAYILDLNLKGNEMDVQFYDVLPDGRYIVNLEIPKEKKADNLELGETYLFELKVFKASLSDKLVKLLSEEYSTIMDHIYRFEFISAEKLNEEE